MLTKLTQVQEMLHEDDKKKNPDRHRIIQDSYLYHEAKQMCTYCCEYYDWNNLFEYDPRTDRFYRKLLEGEE